MATIIPEIISIVPSKNSIDIELNPQILATFNTDIDKATIITNNIFLQDSSKNYIPIDLNYHALMKVLEIHPKAPLMPDAAYTLTIKGDTPITGTQIDGITDIMGIPMVGNFVAAFTTGITPGNAYVAYDDIYVAPIEEVDGDDTIDSYVNLVDIYPHINTANLAAGNITLTFDNELDSSSLTTTNIKVYRKSNL